jgi:hypothetical protein
MHYSASILAPGPNPAGGFFFETLISTHAEKACKARFFKIMLHSGSVQPRLE